MLRVHVDEDAGAELTAGLDAIVAEGAGRMLAAALEAEVDAYVPKSAQPAARAALKEVRDAEDRAHAEKAIAAFVNDYEAKWPKATEKITEDRGELLAFFDFPAEHWVHLKTTNPIESTFATVRLRTKVTKGPGSRAGGLAMAYKLIESAQARWRMVNPTSSHWSVLA